MNETTKRQTQEQAQANLDALFNNSAPSVPDESTKNWKTNFNTSSAAVIPPENGDVLTELPIMLLDDFAVGVDHQPFRSYTEKELEELKDDITRNGVIQPLIVRRKAGGRYEIIAGHNRRTGAQEVGYTTVPCVVRKLTDEEAILQMISTNLQQRKKLLPSEKAFAYKLQLEAMKRQGYRTDLTSPQVAARFRSDDEVAKNAGISGDTVRRYIRLTYLTPDLLRHVDAGEIGLAIGATLSYLSLENQRETERYCFIDHHLYISQEIADKLKQADKEGAVFSTGLLQDLVQVQVKNMRALSIPTKTLQRYFPEDTPKQDIERTIAKALALYFEK